jgi:hypothetical protein
MRNLAVRKADSPLSEASEEGIARAVIDRDPRAHALILVTGAPGAGKSHLVCWLNHRLAKQLAQKGDRVVFIARRDASLRGVLDRLAEEFGTPELTKGLHDIARTLNKRGRMLEFLDALARLVDPSAVEDPFEGAELAEELGLADLLRDRGVRSLWMEPGGPPDRACRRLFGSTEGALPEDEQDEFNLGDLELLFRAARGQMEPKVFESLGLLRRDVARQHGVVELLNSRRRGAILDWFRIDRTALVRALTQFRKQVFPHRLVLLIEDVSCFQGVDDQLMEALVQQAGRSEKLAALCSVVGVTNHYYTTQIEPKGNITDRVTHHVALTQGDGQAISLNSEVDIAAFVARYLNVLRLPPKKLNEWFATSEAVTDPPSACEAKICPHASACHKAFGQANGMGLYPFNSTMLARVFRALYDPSKSSKDLAATPRRLLEFLRNALVVAEGLRQGRFPNQDLLRANVSEDYLPRVERARFHQLQMQYPAAAEQMELLLRLWGTPDNSASSPTSTNGLSASVFSALRLPILNGSTPTLSPSPVSTAPASPGPTTPSPQPRPAPSPVAEGGVGREEEALLNRKIATIGAWGQGEPLFLDQDHRKAVHGLLLNTIPWTDAGVPGKLVEQLFPEAAVSFDGLPDAKRLAVVVLPRTSLVTDTLEALARFGLETKVSERLFLRDRVDAFLREWGPRVARGVAAKIPQAGKAPWNPALTALEALYIDAAVRDRLVLDLPDHKLLPRLLRPAEPTDEIRTGSPHWQAVARCLDGFDARRRTRREVLQETCALWLDRPPASLSSKNDFLDLGTILAAFRAFRSSLEFSSRPAEAPGRPVEDLGTVWTAAYDVQRTLDAGLAQERASLATAAERLEELSADSGGVIALVNAGDALLEQLRKSQPNMVFQHEPGWTDARTKAASSGISRSGGERTWTPERVREVLDSIRAALAKDDRSGQLTTYLGLPAAEIAAAVDLVQSGLRMLNLLARFAGEDLSAPLRVEVAGHWDRYLTARRQALDALQQFGKPVANG